MSTTSQPRLDKTTLGLFGIIVGMTTLTCWDQWKIWSTQNDYTFGYLVPFFSAYVLYERWDELYAYFTGQKTIIGNPTSRWFLAVVYFTALFSILSFTGGGVVRAIYGTGVGPTMAISFGLVGTVLSFGFISAQGPEGSTPSNAVRWSIVGLLLFPACVWIISGPFLHLVDTRIKGELLTDVTEFVSGILRLSGETIKVNGNTIEFANKDAVGIADACSGIRSLSACVFVGAFLGAIFIEGGFPGSLFRRIFLIIISGAVAVMVNIFRNTYLAFYALEHRSASLDRDFWGAEMGSKDFSFLGTVHDFAGNSSMLIAFVLLLACVPLVNRIGRSSSPAE
jgi:exosortase/archaeosortase family protein